MSELKSSAFDNGGKIPREYTCEGDDVSPPLAWDAVAPDTASFALVVDDPDAPDPKNPKTRWVPWVVFDLPAEVRGLPENALLLPPGTRRGLNDWKQLGYRGPCPPIGRHRYFFKLYALDLATLGLEIPTRQELERAIEGHILATSELMGTYQKGDN